MRYGTVTHPFLLADNRHYTFYVWKNLMLPYPMFRYALLPLYGLAGWSLWKECRRHNGKYDSSVQADRAH